MNKSICLCFQVHQPYRLRTYRFFDIGKRHFYYDEYNNRTVIQRVSERCYLPMNELIMDMIARYGDKVKFAFSFSGSVIEQLDLYAPSTLDSFKNILKSGNVELLAETYGHSLASLANKDAFKKEVLAHKRLMREVFGMTPKTFHNTELIYSNDIGADVAEMGYDLIFTEGAKHVLGWRSPNYMYFNAKNPKLKVLLRNDRLSDDIALNFTSSPITAQDYALKIKDFPETEEIVNIFVNYETFGECYAAETGIFDYMRYLPQAVFDNTDCNFIMPHQAVKLMQPMGVFDAPIPLSCCDEERDLSPWIGNSMQDDAFNTLYDCYNMVKRIKNEEIIRDWHALQDSSIFRDLCTKYDDNTPYDTYINYMNILTDFKLRLESELHKNKTKKIVKQ